MAESVAGSTGWLFVAASLLLSGACGRSTHASPGSSEEPLGDTLHVVAGADLTDADGSEEQPFPTLEAAAAAAAGDARWYGRVLVHSGRHEIPDEVHLPPTAALVVESDTTLALGPAVSIVAQRAVELRGTEQSYVTLTWLVDGEPWGALVVTDAAEESVLEYPIVSYGSRSSDSVLRATASLSFIRSAARITGARLRDSEDDGILLRDSSAYVGLCWFETTGNGLNIYGSAPVDVDRNLFVGSRGDAVRTHGGSQALVRHNLIVRALDKGISIGEPNTAPVVEHNVILNSRMGIAIKDGATPLVAHNTLHGNDLGLAVYDKEVGYGLGAGVARDNIIWASTEADLSIDPASEVSLTYSCVQNPVSRSFALDTGDPVEWLVEGEGLISPGNGCDDPLFQDPERDTPFGGDFHLRSEGGRWHPDEMEFVTDDVTSPCIDAGDPAEGVGEETEPNGARSELGAYGGTSEASRSP